MYVVACVTTANRRPPTAGRKQQTANRAQQTAGGLGYLSPLGRSVSVSSFDSNLNGPVSILIRHLTGSGFPSGARHTSEQVKPHP